MRDISAGCKFVGVGEGGAPVASGFVASSLAYGLAMRGHRVVLVDANPNESNVHTLLGIPFPEKTLDCLELEGADSLSDFLIPTSVETLHLLCVNPVVLEAFESDNPGKQKSPGVFGRLEADFALINTGSGGTTGIVDFFNLADSGIVAAGSSQTALRSAFVFLRTAVQRRLLRLFDCSSTLRGEIESVIDEGRAPGNIQAMLSLIRVRDQDRYERAKRTLLASRYRLILHGELDGDGEKIANAFSAAANQYLKVRLPYLGNIQGKREDEGIVITESIGDIVDKIMEKEPTMRTRSSPAGKGKGKATGSRKSGSPRLFQLGINEEIDVGGIKLHVQTEDLGVSQRKILTIVFRGGEVLYSKTTRYQGLAQDESGEAVREMVTLQHKSVVDNIRKGMLTDRIPT